MACVAHLDLDAFYVSVELRRRPELRGLPVVVAGSGPRAVVTTASYEARRFGVQSATPASRARRLCPQAVFVSPDFDAYRSASRAVMALVRAQVARVEVVGLDEAYLDLDGLVAPHAAMRTLVGEIRERTGLQASVGIGPNKLVAKVASDAEKPAGFVVLTQAQAAARFAEAPPGLLPGIGPKTAARLGEMGLGTVGALAAAPEALLTERFGERQGPYLRRRARFQDEAPVAGGRPAVSESRETTFPHDVAGLPALEEILRGLTEQLCADLVRRERRGRTVAIKVRLEDFSTHTRARTLPQAVAAFEEVWPVACELLHRFAPARPVRLLGVRVAGLDEALREPVPAAPQLALEL